MHNQVVLKGNLKFLNLGDLMQLIGANCNSGTLRMHSKYTAEPGIIFFDKGNPINASYGSKTGLDAVYTFFGWTEGEFEFVKEKIISKKIITKSRMGIILEGLKMIDDGKIEKLGPKILDQEISGSTKKNPGMPVVNGPLVDYMYVVDEEDFFDGENIVEEGRHGSWLWVLMEGVVEIRKETSKGTLPIIRLSDGSFIGSMAAFLIQGNIRTATAVAIGNVQLGVLDSQLLSQEYSSLSSEFKGLLMSIDKRLKLVTNMAADYYTNRSINDEQINNDKKNIIQQGEIEEKLYIIKQGKATVGRYNDNNFIPLCNLYKGDFIGHMPFFDLNHEPDYAAVLASKDIKLREIDMEQLQNEFQKLSSTLKNITEFTANCICATSKVVCDFYQQYSGSDSKNE